MTPIPIPIPDTWVRLALPETVFGYFGMFGTASIPVYAGRAEYRGTGVLSVRTRYRGYHVLSEAIPTQFGVITWHFVGASHGGMLAPSPPHHNKGLHTCRPYAPMFDESTVKERISQQSCTNSRGHPKHTHDYGSPTPSRANGNSTAPVQNLQLPLVLVVSGTSVPSHISVGYVIHSVSGRVCHAAESCRR